MEIRRKHDDLGTRALVCSFYDYLVCCSLPIWCILLTTCSVIIPWVTLREVPVEVEIVSLYYLITSQLLLLTRTQPSPKVAVIRFDRGMQQGLLGRISRTSIMEYHAFGIISEGRKAKYHYMICGVQGDFTKDIVANPPKTVWTRELKFGKRTFYLLSLC